MNTETQSTPEQLAKWREHADFAYHVTGSGILEGYNKESFEAGYIRANQENDQAMKLMEKADNISAQHARKQALEEAIAILDDNKTNSTGAHITLNALRELLK